MATHPTDNLDQLFADVEKAHGIKLHDDVKAKVKADLEATHNYAHPLGKTFSDPHGAIADYTAAMHEHHAKTGKFDLLPHQDPHLTESLYEGKKPKTLYTPPAPPPPPLPKTPHPTDNLGKIFADVEKKHGIKLNDAVKQQVRQDLMATHAFAVKEGTASALNASHAHVIADYTGALHAHHAANSGSLHMWDHTNPHLYDHLYKGKNLTAPLNKLPPARTFWNKVGSGVVRGAEIGAIGSGLAAPAVSSAWQGTKKAIGRAGLIGGGVFAGLAGLAFLSSRSASSAASYTPLPDRFTGAGDGGLEKLPDVVSFAEPAQKQDWVSRTQQQTNDRSTPTLSA